MAIYHILYLQANYTTRYTVTYNIHIVHGSFMIEAIR